MDAIPSVRATDPTGAGSMDLIQSMCCQIVGDGLCMAAQGAGFDAFAGFGAGGFPENRFFKVVAVGVYRQAEGVFCPAHGTDRSSSSGIHAGRCLQNG